MESGFCRVLLAVARVAVALLALGAVSPVGAGEGPLIQPEVPRREISVPAIDTEDFEIGVYAGIISVEDFGANSVRGARLAYHVNETVFFEGTYGEADTQKTSYERLSGVALMTSDQRHYRYYNISLGLNVLQGEAYLGQRRAYTTALYLIGGAGATHFAGGDVFTVNFGGGYRLLLTDWLALHLDVRDHMFNSDLLGQRKTTHNIETTGGVSVFF